jgi:immune inhibitor A
MKNDDIIKEACGQSNIENLNSNDGYSDGLMPVPPSPELQKKIREDLAKMRSKARGPLARHLTARASSPPGKDDGLIYPGELFPLGTSAAPVRSAAADRGPVKGTIRVIVVLAEFTDKALGQSAQHYKDLFFSKGVLPHGSLREYFAEVSNGQVDFVGEVVGPYTLPLKLTEYADSDNGCPEPWAYRTPNARTMAKDAAIAANPDVNFAPYDNDGDGFVDAFVVVHAGPDGAATGNPGDIWSHKWTFEGSPYAADTVKIYGYITVPDDAAIGVCCHELGHLFFGWPDLYDTDYSSEGIGDWCLMAAGNWNGNGEIPAHPSAWCKAQQEWVTIACPTASGTQSIQAVETGKTVLRLWKDCAGGQEYFLVENRQKIGSDQALPGDGLLIWHVDDAIPSNTNESHPKVSLLQADSKKDLENGANRGDAGDPYPGSSGNTSFTKATTPTSRSYGGIDTCVSITNISPSAAVMTANVATSCEIIHKSIKDDFKRFKKELKKDINQEKLVHKDLKDIKMDKSEYKELSDTRPTTWPQMRGADIRSGGQETELSVLETRVSALEARLGLAEPFIEAALRPDLSQGALFEEPDVTDQGGPRVGRPISSKRSLDAPQGGW